MSALLSIGSSYSGSPGGDLISKYTDGGFEPYMTERTETGGYYHYIHTFTNTSGTDRTVREVALANSMRVIIDESAIQNMGIVPNGVSITIDYYFSTGSPSPPKHVTATIDTSTFTNAAAIHYNGNPLPNASITGISPVYGGKSWAFKCYTETQSEIDALQAFVCPMEVGISITGRQYVKSALPSGTLFIKDLTTRAKVSYANCFIQSIDIEPMLLSSGLLGQWFNITVVQSAYADA